MTPLEDRLRTALHETGLEIPPTAPPLRLDRRRLKVSAWRTRAWYVPAAAAVLVGAVIAGSLALTGGVHARSGQPGDGRLAGVPAYFVALVTPAVDAAWAVRADIRATATGATLASVTPPKPYTVFAGITATADDRTFVLAATTAGSQGHGTYPAEQFYLLRLRQDGTVTSLRGLAIRDIPAGVAAQSIALSPDGTQLAAVIGGSGLWSRKVYLFNLETGTERVWKSGSCVLNGTMASYEIRPSTLSWTADGRYVAFGCVLIPPGDPQATDATVRLLDTAAPGPDLVADSRVIVTNAATPLGVQAMVTPDGRWVVDARSLGALPEIEEFPVRPANRLAARILPGRFTEVMWTSTDGSALILHRTGSHPGVVLVRDGHATPLPGQIGVAAW